MFMLLILLSLLLSLFIYGLYHFCWDFRQPIPGIKPTDRREGNWGDIRRAGSMHEFLVDLHAEKGDLVSFWLGPQMAVSLASPELFKAVTKLHNRPGDLLALIVKLATGETISTAYDEEWRKKRAIHDPAFCHSSMTNYYELISDSVGELVSQLSTVPPGEHVGLTKCMHDAIIKNTTRCLLGGDFSDENIRKFCQGYDWCWEEIERQMAGDIPAEESMRMSTFYRRRQEMIEPILEAVARRRQSSVKPGTQFLIDAIIEHEVAENEIVPEIINYVVAGYHTTAQLCVWLFYYIAIHPDVQTKLYEELQHVIGDGEVTPSNIADLTYMRQVINETLRISRIFAWTVRELDKDHQLAGYIVPAKTIILQEIGVVMMDPKIWPDPDKFDPERFSQANSSQRPNLSFEPFGFAGKRKCVGYRLAYLEATIFLSLLVPKFWFKLLEGQNIEINYGFMSKPKSEIWVTVEKRN